MTEIVFTQEARELSSDEQEAAYTTLSNQSSDDNLRSRKQNSIIDGNYSDKSNL